MSDEITLDAVVPVVFADGTIQHVVVARRPGGRYPDYLKIPDLPLWKCLRPKVCDLSWQMNTYLDAAIPMYVERGAERSIAVIGAIAEHIESLGSAMVLVPGGSR